MKDYLKDIVQAAPAPMRTNIMREYLQARVLEVMQAQDAWTSVAFMGGTALRFLYQIPRFSEDLDFSLENAEAGYDFEGLLEAVRARFLKEEYQCETKTATRTTVNKAFVRFPGLPHELGLSPHINAVFSVKIEVDTNPPAGAGLESSLVRRYVTLRIAHHDRASLLAGKIAALLMREWVKGRDVYDLVWYLSDPQWPEPNERLLSAALEQGGRSDLQGGLWRRALSERLYAAPWDGVLADVERFLLEPDQAWMVERETVGSVLRQRGWAQDR
ncbi:MAG: nucleotidyl transferase AbiEii/AbiGii toxin family protein [Coriobacteriia bacterium]|nr:nucleotidyl transferase AbiEii/AbiGii toxin family protein [Coriobacteriia bacterium]